MYFIVNHICMLPQNFYKQVATAAPCTQYLIRCSCNNLFLENQ